MKIAKERQHLSMGDEHIDASFREAITQVHSRLEGKPPMARIPFRKSGQGRFQAKKWYYWKAGTDGLLKRSVIAQPEVAFEPDEYDVLFGHACPLTTIAPRWFSHLCQDRIFDRIQTLML